MCRLLGVLKTRAFSEFNRNAKTVRLFCQKIKMLPSFIPASSKKLSRSACGIGLERID
jgi:hypothetical protein